MNIFANLKKYAGKWNESNVRPFSKDEIDAVKSASVVDSEFGFSVCFIAKTGGKWFIPLEHESSKQAGDVIDISTAQLVTLSREGSSDIYRVRA